MSEIVYCRAETDDAEAICWPSVALGDQPYAAYPDERAKSVDDMRFVIQRFHEMPRHFLSMHGTAISASVKRFVWAVTSEQTRRPGRRRSPGLALRQGVGKGLMQK